MDGDNFSAASVERILARYPGVVLASVYAVPDDDVGDQVMAALEMKNPRAFDPAAFDAFLAGQSDLGIKWSPRYVRIRSALPVTETSKVKKRQLRSESWECEDPVWFRPGLSDDLRRMVPRDREALSAAFSARGRENLLI